MAWRRGNLGPKISLLLCFLFQPTFLPSFSLQRLFSPWRPYRRLPPPPKYGSAASLQTQILTSGRTVTATAGPSPAADFLLLLSSCSTTGRHLFHSLNRRPHVSPSSSRPARPPSTSGSIVSPLLPTRLLHVERILVLHAAWLISMVAGLGQQPCGPGWDHLGPAWPKKRKDMLGRDRPNQKFMGLAQLSGPGRPTCF